MTKLGRCKQAAGIGVVLVGASALASACSSPERDFGAAHGGEGAGLGGQSASSGSAEVAGGGASSGSHPGGGTGFGGASGGATGTSGGPQQTGGDATSDAGSGPEAGSGGEPAQMVCNCTNGGTCDGATGTCSCSAKFNGPHCEFQTFRGIGMLATASDSYATGISHDGSTVIAYSTPQGSGQRCARSVNGAALQSLGTLPVTETESCRPTAVDASGTVTGFYDGPFLYSAGKLATIDGLSGIEDATEISAVGGVVVGGLEGTGQAYVRKSSGAITWFGPVNGAGEASSEPSAVNRDGAFVVGSDFDGPIVANSEFRSLWDGYLAWRWDAQNSQVQLAYVPPCQTCGYAATDTTPDGKVIVGWTATGAKHELRNCVTWTGASYSPTYLGGGRCVATNKDGTVLVGLNAEDVANAALVWDGAGAAHNILTLLGATPDLANWTLTEAVGVSDDGKWVVGNGMNNGHHAGWVAHLP